ncbi:MAG: LamG domain-containing protein [Acidobacteriaceae bacterium]|nr:LamG domain-containing protein [Acidobacteriaceae bacterium]
MNILIPRVLLFFAAAVIPAAVSAQTAVNEVHWPFSSEQSSSPVDSVHGVAGKLEGKFQYVPGVTGDALRLDGYTTSMTVAASEIPAMGPGGFTLEAWVALNTYPWNWVPIADQEAQRQAGYFFGIDAFGHVALGASIDGQWHSAVSTVTVPLKQWAHLAGTYQTDPANNGQGILTVYMNGERIAQTPVQGSFSPAKVDLLVGRVRQPALPFPEAEVKPPHAVWYSLDGILDELRIFGRARSGQEIAQDYAAVSAPKGDVLPWQKMPSGPIGPGRFGAYYASLRYEEPWDRLRQIGPNADVVVRFDESPTRLVFWQGLNYVPAWVSGDDKWSTNEFLEVWDSGCPDGGDCEPMSDKQSLFSHVEILESNEVRAVVHWRYALIETVGFKGAWHDPLTGWTDWADEYWTIYPDGVAVRKQVIHTARVNAVREWQETIILNQPGQRPEDNINPDAVTLGNMQGATKTYTWQKNPAGAFADPIGPADTSTPPNVNMQLVNLRSEWKPFQIVPPDGVSSDFYNNEKSYFLFECWNHWPVAQIASSDRPCVTNDRPSHSSVSHLFWKPYAETDDTATKILLNGLTTSSLPELIPLAKSWLTPPPLELQSNSYRSEGYDPAQRAYLISGAKPAGEGAAAPLRLVFHASETSPLFHMAILIRNWGGNDASLVLDGRPVPWGKEFRKSLVPGLDSTDLLLWIETRSSKPVQVEIRSATAM